MLVYAAHYATHGRANCARAGSAPRANCTYLHGDTGCGHLCDHTGSSSRQRTRRRTPFRTGSSFSAVSPEPVARVLSDLTTRTRAARTSSWGYTLHQPDHRPPPLSRTPARGAAVLAMPLRPAPRTHEPRLVDFRIYRTYFLSLDQTRLEVGAEWAGGCAGRGAAMPQITRAWFV